jgi:hypothetical protein
LLELGLLILIHGSGLLSLDRRHSLQGRVLSYVLFGHLANGIKFLQDKRSTSSLFWSQEFNQLLVILRNLSFCGELFLGQFKTLLLFLFLHFLDRNILENRVNNRLGFLRSNNLSLSLAQDSLGNDVVAVNTDVLEKRMRDKGVSGELLEEVNLLRLRSF